MLVNRVTRHKIDSRTKNIVKLIRVALESQRRKRNRRDEELILISSMD